MKTLSIALIFGFALCSCGKKGGCPDPALKRQNRHAICQDIYQPICGCDGRTYGNECEARTKGITVAYTGECGD